MAPKQWKSHEMRIKNSLVLTEEGMRHSEQVHGDEHMYTDCTECLRIAKAVLDELGVRPEDLSNSDLMRTAPPSIRQIAAVLAKQAGERQESAWNQKSH